MVTNKKKNERWINLLLSFLSVNTSTETVIIANDRAIKASTANSPSHTICWVALWVLRLVKTCSTTMTASKSLKHFKVWVLIYFTATLGGTHFYKPNSRAKRITFKARIFQSPNATTEIMHSLVELQWRTSARAVQPNGYSRHTHTHTHTHTHAGVG